MAHGEGDLRAETLQAIIEERDTLREELLQLRETISEGVAPLCAPLTLVLPGCTATQARMLAALFQAYPNAVSRARLMELRLVRHDGAGPKVVDVRISQLRRLLRQRRAPDPAIGVIWAYGYFLIPDAYHWIQLQLRGAHAQSA